jgi:antitoxin component of RelBE/YafQ-DinJ toxin-antitoxin module
VFVGEEALGAFAGDFVHRVDEEGFPSAGFGILRAADDDAGFHARIVDEVWAEAEDALDEVGFDEFAAHFRLLLPEDDAVGPDDDARFHRRVVKQVRAEAEDTFDEVGFDELASHVGFLLPE